MRVLITGARGLLGAAMLREFGNEQVHAFGHQELDVADEPAVTAAVAAARPDVVINCAAYNDVDRAEQEPDAALRVNALGVLALARAARQAGAVLVHYSTDFVFDGEADRPYTEEDPPNPRGIYATSKLLGDWFTRDANRAYVLRVDSLFGPPSPGGGRRGSLGTIVDRIRNGEEVPVFIDRTVSPTYTPDIAWATRAVLERGLPAGLYHCVNAGAAPWARIAEEAALTLETANLVAPRPRYCALSPAKLAAAGIVMPTWEEALRRYLLGSSPALSQP
jgi:dTDP-4-dehydrorhamnose reductase